MHSGLSSDFLEKKIWRFSSSAGPVFSDHFRLLPGGKIGGYFHANESSWSFDEGQISLFHLDGRLTARLAPKGSADDALITFSGKILVGESEHFHLLTTSTPTIGCFLRTHFWNDDVEKAYFLLLEHWGGEVIIAADQTHRFELPVNIPAINHSAGALTLMGLPPIPNHNTSMWFNGDYIFSHLAMHSDFDYFVVCEYDLSVTLDLDALVKEIVSSGADFVAAGYGKAHPDWKWFEVQKNWMDFETGFRPHAIATDADIYGCFFPFTVCSREAAIRLLVRRVECGWLHSAAGAAPWPFCESFVPTEIARSHLRGAALEKFAAEKMAMTVNDALTWPEATKITDRIIHPVLGGRRFVEKLTLHSEYLPLNTFIEKHRWLSKQRVRCPSQVERDILDQMLEDLA